MEKRPVQVLSRLGSPEACSLSVGAVDVVPRRLEVDRPEAARLERLLAPRERERADRLLVDHRRLDFIVARGRLRELLGRALGSNPTDVPLEVGPTGKPMLG